MSSLTSKLRTFLYKVANQVFYKYQRGSNKLSFITIMTTNPYNSFAATANTLLFTVTENVRLKERKYMLAKANWLTKTTKYMSNLFAHYWKFSYETHKAIIVDNIIKNIQIQYTAWWTSVLSSSICCCLTYNSLLPARLNMFQNQTNLNLQERTWVGKNHAQKTVNGGLQSIKLPTLCCQLTFANGS